MNAFESNSASPVQRTRAAEFPARGTDAQELDLRKLLDTLWSGRWIVAAAVLIALLLAGLYLIAARPVFVADGLLQVEEDKSAMGGTSEGLSALFGGVVKTAAELEILKSRMVLGKVIDELRLEIVAEPRYFPLFGRFLARQSGDRIEVSSFKVPDPLQGERFTLVITEQGYELQDPDQETVLTGTVGVPAEGKVQSGSIRLFVKDLAAPPGRRFTLIRSSHERTHERLLDRFKVREQGRQSGVIRLSAEDYSPVQAAAIIRRAEDTYVRQNVERRSSEAQQSLEFLEKQLPAIKEKVDAAQAQLNAFQIKEDSVDVTKETELILEQAVELETQRLALQQKRKEALPRFTPQHPAVIALDSQIAAVEAELAKIKSLTEALPTKQQEILNYLRDLEVNRQIYITLLNSAQELQVAKASTIGNVRVIDYPLVPGKKSRPKETLVLALALMLGLIAGGALTYLRASLNKGVSNPSEVEQALGLVTYASIPYSRVQGRLRRKIRKGEPGLHVLAIKEPLDVSIEAVRSLRTSLQFALLESANNVLMLTGPTPALGKSFVSINLAAVLASTGKKVAVVDCDLRKGSLHQYAGLPQAPGVTDYVLGQVQASQIACDVQAGKLVIYPRGIQAPNPAELLLHSRFVELIQNLSRDYDLVIIDAPPVLPVTDACVMGSLAGCTLIVLKDHAHPMSAIEETVRRLRNAGVHPKGVVFNQVGRTAASYGYRAYGEYRHDQKYE